MNKKQLFSALIFLFSLCIASGYAQGNLDTRGNVPGFKYNFNDGQEPTMQKALQWWPDQQNMWTPVGWKDHYFRFNVMYNGAIILDLAPGFSPREHSKRWLGEDFLVSFHTNADGKPNALPKEKINTNKLDGGYGTQGWNENHETPILWTDYQLQEGLVIRQELFAHTYGAKDVETAIEPLYGWIRLSVIHVDEIRHPEKHPVVVQLSKNYYEHGDQGYEYAITVDVNPEKAKYPKILKEKRFTQNGKTGIKITEPDNKIRMVVLPTDNERVSFTQTPEGIYALTIDMNAQVGDYVDLLLPMLPEDESVINKEIALGRDNALAESDKYWSVKPEGIARFHVPEDFINKTFDQSIKFASVVAEKDYITSEYSYHSGSWAYDVLWSTPTSMMSHMFLDQFGYFGMTRKYSEIFHKNQGTIKPPGDLFEKHPGYFSSPKTLTSIDWITDHGAILLQVSTHALLSHDQEFIDYWIDPIVKACDFLKDASLITNHDGVPGLLPPGVATDEETSYQAIWNIAWNHKGLVTAVRLLKKINHPRAQEFEEFAQQTKETFNKAYRELAENGDVWTDDNGKKRYAPPTMLSKNKPPYHRFSEAFYLDTGPMVLVWAELMDAEDILMRDAVDFFRCGPNKKLWGNVYHALNRPFLIHELSTCEPCYSWNVFSSWQLNDRYHYLECMYSLFAGALSQQTYISCEHRHGIQGTLFATPLAFYLVRLAVIDEVIKPGELHLLRFCPQAWVSSSEDTFFENMPTEFGEVSIRFNKSEDGKTLHVNYDNKFGITPQKTVLHIPPVDGLEFVNVNNQQYPVPESGQIIL